MQRWLCEWIVEVEAEARRAMEAICRVEAHSVGYMSSSYHEDIADSSSLERCYGIFPDVVRLSSCPALRMREAIFV